LLIGRADSSDFGVTEPTSAARKSAGASDALEAPAFIGGPSRTRTLDPLIKSDPKSISIAVQDDLKLEDPYTWD